MLYTRAANVVAGCRNVINSVVEIPSREAGQAIGAIQCLALSAIGLAVDCIRLLEEITHLLLTGHERPD